MRDTKPDNAVPIVPATPDMPALEARFARLVSDARVLLRVVKSVKGLLSQGGGASSGPSDPSGSSGRSEGASRVPSGGNGLYGAAIGRFRTACARLAGFADAVAAALGEDARDRLLAREGCSWDESRGRVSLGELDTGGGSPG